MKKITSIVLNNFKNDSRVLKENISLQNAGYSVKVVALYEDGLKEYENIQNIPVHRIKLISKNWSKNKAVQLFKYFEFLFRVVINYRNSDIIHCNDLNTLPIGVLIKKIFNKNVKIVYDAHEYEINDTPNQSKFSIRLRYILEKFFIRYADKVMTVSDSIANKYTELYNIAKPALVLNTPPYQEIEKKNIFRERFAINEKQTIFLYQGGLSSGRGIEILLELFKRLSKETEEVVIIFMGYGPLEEMVEAYAAKYENIYLHEAVSPEVLLNYTSSVDFGISTIEDSCLSYRYCLPNKLFEYLMAEIPVIVSNLYEMRRLVERNGIGVIAQENNVAGLKEAIFKATELDHTVLRRNIQKVKAVYNWEMQEKVLLDVYRELE